MGEPLECNPVISSSSASYEDASLGISLDPSAQVSVYAPDVDLTGGNRSTSGDSYSFSLRLPSHLSPNANIRVSDGHGGSRDVHLADLIRESRSDASARANLKTLASAAASIPGILDRCYVGSEENLLPMLAQLGSSDPIARHEGALSLQDFIQRHPQDRALQQGLVATVAEMAQEDQSNTEARQFLVAVSQDNSPQNAGLRQWMSRQPNISPLMPNANAVAQNNSAGAAPTAPATLALDAVPGSEGSATVVTTTKSLIANSAPVNPTAPLAPAVNDRLVALIETRTAGTPLEGIPTEGILNFAQAQASLPAGQFEDLLRLRILADALPLNGFTGNLFGTSATVAGLLAEDIRRVMGRDTGSVEARPLSLASSVAHADDRDVSASAPTLTLTGSHPVSVAANAPVDGTRALLNPSLPVFAANFFVPSLLTSLSGMQGASSQPNGVVASPLSTLAFGLSGHSNYHVEGPTSLDEDGHQGFGGQSSGNGSGQEGGDHHDERHDAPDAYLA